MALSAIAALAIACDWGPLQNSDTLATSQTVPDAGGHHSTAGSGGSRAVQRVDAGAPIDAAVSGDDGGDQTGTSGTGGGGAAGANTPPLTMPSGGATNPTSAGQAGGRSVPPPNPFIFWLDATGNRVWQANTDGTNRQSIAYGQGISTPDGIAVDPIGGYIYWTNMGSPLGGANLGSLQRVKLGAIVVETVVPIGTTNTPKQLAIDRVHSQLYWCDREGGRVWRSKLDGSVPEVLVSGHDLMQPVGIALDVDKAQFYFTDRLARKIYRAGFALPSGQGDADRTDLEELFAFSGNAMPLDLDLDLDQRKLYWTDRARGSVQRAGMDLPANSATLDRTDVETLATNLPDPLGISIDSVEKQLYFTQLNGEVWRANLDGTQRRVIVSTGSASGVTLARLP